MGLHWRVINQSPITLIVGSFGMKSGMAARLTVSPGQSKELRDNNGQLLTLDEGNRVFVAWDDFSGEVKAQSVFSVLDSLGHSITLAVFNNFNMDVTYS
jgi:hypothetical protein